MALHFSKLENLLVRKMVWKEMAVSVLMLPSYAVSFSHPACAQDGDLFPPACHVAVHPCQLLPCPHLSPHSGCTPWAPGL